MVWKVFWNRFHRQRKKKRRDTSKVDPEAILISSSSLQDERQDELSPSQYVLLSDALDDNPVVLVGKMEAFGGGAHSKCVDTCTTASQPALISPDSTEATNGKWVSRWDNVSEDISGSHTTESPITSHQSHSRDGTTSSTSGRAGIIDAISSTSTNSASQSTITSTPIPQLLTFVEKPPQHQLNTSSRTIHSHSTYTSGAHDSVCTSHLSTTRAVPLSGTTTTTITSTNPNSINTSTRTGFSHMTNTTANSTTTSGTANTLVSSLYITAPSSNTHRNPKYDFHTVAEEDDDDGVEDLEILRRICCSVNPKELVHIMEEKYSCLLVDDQMKNMVQKMLQKEKQQEETLQQNHIQNHIDTITARIQTEDPLQHLGFEAELLK